MISETVGYLLTGTFIEIGQNRRLPFYLADTLSFDLNISETKSNFVTALHFLWCGILMAASSLCLLHLDTGRLGRNGNLQQEIASFMHIDWETFTDSTRETADVRLLGTADLDSVVLLQKLMVHEVRQQNRTSASVLICEHPPVVTRGRSSSLLELPVDRRELESRSLDVRTVSRDGGVICHLPGRLAAYVVVSLNERDYGLNEFRWRLQDSVISTCQSSQIKAFRSDSDVNALWARQGVICEFGVGEEDGVTCFGFHLNVNCELDSLSIVGRGLAGQRFSSFNRERHRLTPMAVVRTELIKNICQQIGYPEYHLYTGHPFLARKKRVTG